MWYVMQVMRGQEENVIHQIDTTISQEEYERCFCPRRERQVKYQGSWKKVREILFPGYLFVITETPERFFLALKSLPKLTKLLADDEYTFFALPEEDVQFLKQFGDEQAVSHLSQVTVEEGNEVVIVSGELLNYEGRIVKINLHKRIAVVRIPFMGQEMDIHLGIEMVEKK